MHAAFISHSHCDVECAKAICAYLESHGEKCWICTRDIPSGLDFAQEIMNAIGDSRSMVLLLSPESCESPHVRNEIDRATVKGVQLIPVRLQNFKIPERLEYYIGRWQRVEAIEAPFEQHLPKILTAVRKSSDGELGGGMQIMIAYKRGAQKDERLVGLLDQHLKASGHSVFIDRQMSIGVAWAQEIERKIRDADAVIALVSEASVQSEMFAYELQVAHDARQHKGKPRLLPIRVGFNGSIPADLEPVVQRLQYFPWESEQDDQKLLRDVATALRTPPRDPIDMGKIEAVGGAVPLDSPFYLERATDQEFIEAVHRRDSILLVKGARQMGKTSLLARGLAEARKQNIAVAFSDFQKFDRVQLESHEAFYIALGELLVDTLDLDVHPTETWNSKRGPNVNFERFIRREVLSRIQGPLLWALDEVDRLFTCPFGSEVFALFRTWHNERATDPGGPLSRLSLAIAYATEAHLFITDVNQSPFNVGTRIALQDFTLDQIAELNSRYQSPLAGGADVARLYKLVGGQPFLIRRALYEIANKRFAVADLEEVAEDDNGPFGDHLRRLLVMLAKDESLCEVVRGLLRGNGCSAMEDFYRLRSAGLISGTNGRDAVMRCLLYKRYLTKHLL